MEENDEILIYNIGEIYEIRRQSDFHQLHFKAKKELNYPNKQVIDRT